jgi:hypothetical protein
MVVVLANPTMVSESERKLPSSAIRTEILIDPTPGPHPLESQSPSSKRKLSANHKGEGIKRAKVVETQEEKINRVKTMNRLRVQRFRAKKKAEEAAKAKAN